MSNVPSPLSQHLPEYTVLATIYQGTRTTVYRAQARATQQSVVIKTLSQEYPSFSELVQFRNQYTVAKNLPIAGVVRPLGLESYGNGYALVMEDVGGVDLGHYAHPSALSLADILGIAIQLADILHELHQHRVIHKDLKPANILIHPESKHVQLIDFSIASLLPKETQAIQSPGRLEGTLAYLAPEQTGRMNRGIDYRTDFYALGVTLYQLLTGQLPFTSDDPLELIHCHMAQSPTAIDALNPEVPPMLGAIVAKLMAKNAEDRYQSALGLKHDLEHCLRQWQAQGAIADFTLGERDVSDRFLIPEKLYGREQEVQALLDAFERVADSHCEMVLVAGFSGIGKTAVINEVHKPIVRQRGYFIKGKFDQFNRNIPFSAFVQAFRSLMGQLLSESDAQLQQWQAQILQAVGDNGQVLIDVIPELEQIMGPQPAAPQLEGSAAQNRFNLLFQKFIAVFTTPEHPLVLFLDDLQWADSASLNLINVLMGSGETSYLLLLGAYRDNEVFPAHPLMLTLSELEQNRATISTLTLAPLASSHINQFVAETLNCSPELAHPLAELVYQKTRGNPFFATQFLTGLYEDHLITFNLNVGYWECDLAQVRDAALTDDVVEFMVGRLQKLPEATQVGLKLAACIGNQFDLATLAVVCESHQDEVATQLWPALQEGLILPISEAYKFFQGEIGSTETTTIAIGYRFLHDRVQQAAYSLIPGDQREMAHYRIGQRLLQQTPVQDREERIFAIVGQLNYGTDLINRQSERDELAHLNLMACRKARAATAYQAGFAYANTGLALLGRDVWQRQYDMALAFHTLAAELASLCGELDTMERFINNVIEQAHTLLEKVDVYQLRIQANISQNKLTEAIAIGQQLLEQLDIALPIAPTPSDIQHSIAEIGQLMEGQDIEALIQLPMMTDAKKIAIMQIINSIMPPAYISGSLLHPLVVALSVKLSVRSGNTVASAFGYVNYGIIACNLNRDINSGTQFGQLALQVVSNLNARTAKSVILFVVGQFILHRKSHIKETLSIQKEGYATALEVGNLEYVGYCAQAFCFQAFWCGQPLTNLAEETRAYCHALRQLNQLTTASWCQIYWQPILNLLGASEHPTFLSGEALQETERLPQLMANHDAFGLYFFYLYKLMLCYLFADYASAQLHAVEIRKYFKAGAGTVGEPAFYFYDSLRILAVYRSSPLTPSEVVQPVDENQTHLQNDWAHYAPMNHQHKVDLVAAEKCRVLGQKLEAIDLYDHAIAGAKSNDYIQEEALANELAAKFYLDWGKEKIAAGYMQDAYYCYAQWGAKAKVDDLEARYPELLRPILQSSTASVDVLTTLSTFTDPSLSVHGSTHHSSSKTSLNQALDFASVLKASQSLSSTIQLDDLLCQLTQIILQNSGGDRCTLLLPSDTGEWQIQTIAHCSEGNNVVSEQIQLCTKPVNNTANLPVKLIQYVKNSQKEVVFDDLKTDLPIVDNYLRQNNPKSLLCLPILNQGRCIGIILLENQLTQGVFTKERIAILNFLCVQAAISIENARLFDKTLKVGASLQKSQEKLQTTANSLPGLIYQFQLETNGHSSFPYLSDRATELLELAPQILENSADALIECIYPDDLEMYQLAITDSVNTLTPFMWTGRLILPSGRIKWIEARSTPTRQDDGSCVWDGVMLDVSDRKVAEQALLTSELKFRTLLSNLDGVVYRRLNDADWTMEFMSKAIVKLSGYPESDFINNQERTYASVIYADDVVLVKEAVAQGLESRQSFAMEYRIVHRDGSIRWVSEKGKGIFCDAGEFQCLEGVIFDISDRKQAEKAILQKTKALESALAELENAQLQLVQSEKMSALGNLVAGVAHEINNPVGCILGNVRATQDYINDLLGLIDLYADELPEPGPTIEDELEAVDLEYVREDLPNLIRAMKDSGDRITSISKSLRTFSRADTNQKQLFNLHEGIDSTVLILRHRLKANEKRPAIEVITDYGDIPKVNCFPGQLNQVFMNILANAIDALDDASQNLSVAEMKANPQQITIRTSRENDQVQIAIADNGLGIPEAVKSKIFDHLFTTKDVGKGTGLGLAIAYQIITEKHGGSISCLSQLGAGTTITIQIPL